ncbi:hypothetical protein ASPFODRAFT_252310 [Aspergillus luchuensis CBS 106.47]|uniref:Uncharacterized protein n=1 Tax=Aspergillus luchuensis (strain CBS 106.47) TaxID=1137211 RepID=A0A1M3TZK8_ASPLC|nr:hypothetical protein ASPFODRAFT_252310 [Aspergillus luchuensis CBS 106.47]
MIYRKISCFLLFFSPNSSGSHIRILYQRQSTFHFLPPFSLSIYFHRWRSEILDLEIGTWVLCGLREVFLFILLAGRGSVYLSDPISLYYSCDLIVYGKKS